MGQRETLFKDSEEARNSGGSGGFGPGAIASVGDLSESFNKCWASIAELRAMLERQFLQHLFPSRGE